MFEGVSMEQKIYYKSITPPCKMSAKMYLIRFGKILFSLSLIALIISFLPSVSFLMTAFYVLIWFIIVIITLGTVFITNPDFANSLTSSIEILGNISTALYDASLYLLPTAIVMSILSIVFLAMDKTDRHIARIVFASIFLALSVILFIIRLINLGQ